MLLFPPHTQIMMNVPTLQTIANTHAPTQLVPTLAAATQDMFWMWTKDLVMV